MSRLGTVGLCVLVLASLVAMATAEEPDAAAAAATAKALSIRPIDVVNPIEAENNAKIHIALKEQTKIDCKDFPLSDVVAFLAEKHHIEILIDFKALEDASIGPDTEITCKREGVTLRSVLRSMLRQVDLTYIVRDESLVITTPAIANETLVITIYPVGDLAAGRSRALGGENFTALTQIITETIAPTTWDEVGGNGSVVPLAEARSLIVSQTSDVHEQIVELLTALRKARDVQPAAPKITALGSLVDTVAKIASSRQRNQGAPAAAGGGNAAPAGAGMGGGMF